MVNIENFDPNLLKIDKKSYKNIDTDYIDYITVKIKSVNPLYLTISKVDGYLEKKMEINTWFLILRIKTRKY